jgi:YHS domain-containing protein
MRTKINSGVIIILMFLVLSVFSSIALAQEENKPAKVESLRGESVTAVNVGNKICPVSGEKIGDMGNPAHYEYKGKVYNFCCQGCVETFKENPEKYVNSVDQQLMQHNIGQ